MLFLGCNINIFIDVPGEELEPTLLLMLGHICVMQPIKTAVCQVWDLYHIADWIVFCTSRTNHPLRVGKWNGAYFFFCDHSCCHLYKCCSTASKHIWVCGSKGEVTRFKPENPCLDAKKVCDIYIQIDLVRSSCIAFWKDATSGIWSPQNLSWIRMSQIPILLYMTIFVSALTEISWEVQQQPSWWRKLFYVSG